MSSQSLCCLLSTLQNKFLKNRTNEEMSTPLVTTMLSYFSAWQPLDNRHNEPELFCNSLNMSIYLRSLNEIKPSRFGMTRVNNNRILIPLFITPSIQCIFIFPQHLKHHTQNASVYAGMRRPADGEHRIQCQLEKAAFLLSSRCDSKHLEGKWWIWEADMCLLRYQLRY